MNRRNFLSKILCIGAGAGGVIGTQALFEDTKKKEAAKSFKLYEGNNLFVSVWGKKFFDKKIIVDSDVFYQGCEFIGCYIFIKIPITQETDLNFASRFHSFRLNNQVTASVFEHSETIWNQNLNKTALQIWQEKNCGKNA